ncbi:MAG TPA: glycoside hydrolase family 88 protein [Candidatus Bacteroides merdavium]|uniref:Glycoside hydrolase family 88 protein n=1 Tax=Candidatus Bacteroides merdavium TaxID=2838472 RepID=A0A9D2GYL4_9BACE|nr:glycoside hydrolase family 88 protein [uncultured Bacteroides sp.]HIZ92397.1 glycoside hydrolase family 88 protein [Candidatus Bacteroides merdavium]
MKDLFAKLVGGLGVCLFASCVSHSQVEPIESVISRGLDRAAEQAVLMAKELEDKDGRLPKSIKDGKLETSNCYWWCSGFFPGELWYLYEYTQKPELKQYAELFTNRLEKVQYVTDNHDVGFMLYCSYGNGLRLTGNERYKDILVQGARSLSTRYRETVKAIRSWDFGDWEYPVIIDNMMNLELLTWAGKVTGDSTFCNIATNHANTTLKNHFRPDYSCYHVVSYDTISGLPEKKQTHQGYADESAWARGQAWALYGYTMMARETGDEAYLQQAKRVASFLMNHPRMPEDKVPYWDFDTPDIPNTTRDASAAAIMASALIELSQIDQSDKAGDYLAYAEAQLRSLSSSEYLAEAGTNCNFVLKHSTGHFKAGSEVDVPLSYADYYYVEALMRLKKIVE